MSDLELVPRHVNNWPAENPTLYVEYTSRGDEWVLTPRTRGKKWKAAYARFLSLSVEERRALRVNPLEEHLPQRSV